MSIHNYEKKYQMVINRTKKAKISERNKELILQINDSLVLDGISKPRLMKYMEILKIFAVKLDKDFDKATKEDLMKIVSGIQQSNFSPWTKQTYKVIIRRFYRWLHQTKDYPEIVSWINIKMSRSEKRLPSEGDLLKESDINKMLDGAKHPRDKALIAMLWESGARISEIGNLKLKNVAFDKNGAVITVIGKTGSRKVRLIWSIPYLSTWYSNHPFRNEPDTQLWTIINNVNFQKPMTYESIRARLSKIAKEVGIKKRVNPHTFRHSRATFMANHLTEFQMNQYFGWIQGSDMPSTYVHMSGREVDNAILKLNGIAVDQKESEQHLKAQLCPRCETINSHDTTYCKQCGGILSISKAMELEEVRKKEISERSVADELMNVLLQDRDIQTLIREKLKNFS